MRSGLGTLFAVTSLMVTGVSSLADTRGEAVLRRALSALKSVKSLQAEVSVPHGHGTLHLMPPHALRWVVEVKAEDKTTKTTVVQNGSRLNTLVQPPNGTTEQVLKQNNLPTSLEIPKLVLLYRTPSLLTAKGKPTYLGSVTRNARKLEVLKFAGSEEVLFLDSKGFPVGEGSDPKGVQIETSLSNLRLNTSLPPKTFAFVPPKDAKPMEEAVNLEMQNAMLQVGQKAPLFEVRNPLGGTISLAELLKENRAVMVNFWSTGCAACLVEFRKLQKLNEEMQGKGFVLIALNSFDDPDSVRKFLKQNGYTFTVGLSGANGGKKESVDDLFKAQAYPSNYLVGQNGNILWRNFGYEEAEVRQVLEKVGIK